MRLPKIRQFLPIRINLKRNYSKTGFSFCPTLLASLYPPVGGESGPPGRFCISLSFLYVVSNSDRCLKRHTLSEGFFEMRCASDRLHKEYITIGLVAE